SRSPFTACEWAECLHPDLRRADSVRQHQPERRRMRVERRGRFTVLAAEDAYQLLRSPDRWLLDTDEGQVCLCRTDSGMNRKPADWYAAASSRLAGLSLVLVLMRVLIAVLLVFRDAGAYLVHVQFAGLGDQLLQGRLGQRPGLGVEDDVIADDHQGRDG